MKAGIFFQLDEKYRLKSEDIYKPYSQRKMAVVSARESIYGQIERRLTVMKPMTIYD